MFQLGEFKICFSKDKTVCIPLGLFNIWFTLYKELVLEPRSYIIDSSVDSRKWYVFIFKKMSIQFLFFDRHLWIEDRLTSLINSKVDDNLSQ